MEDERDALSEAIGGRGKRLTLEWLRGALVRKFSESKE